MPASTLAIRPFSDGDAEAILNVHYSAIHEAIALEYDANTRDEWAPPVNALRIERFLHDREADGETTLVATDGGDIVGFASMVPVKCVLRAVYISPRYWRRSIGRKLLLAIEELATQEGVPTLHLKSTLSAEAFYRVCGYTKTGDGMHILRSGRKMACVEMCKRL